MKDLISRRDAVLRGGLLLTSLGAVLHPGTAWARRPTKTAAKRSIDGVVYRLQPTRQCTCNACEHHAKNKIFASQLDASKGRAHPGCQCTVVRAPSIPKLQWQELFELQPKLAIESPSRLSHPSVDRRWPWVQKVLRDGRRSSLGR